MIDDFKISIENFIRNCVRQEVTNQLNASIEEISKQELQKVKEAFDDVINEKVAANVKLHFEVISNHLKEENTLDAKTY